MSRSNARQIFQTFSSHEESGGVIEFNKDTKKLMADINKQKAEFKTTCKEFLDEVSKPINAFKEEVKDFAGEYIYSWPSNTKKIKDHK